MADDEITLRRLLEGGGPEVAPLASAIDRLDAEAAEVAASLSEDDRAELVGALDEAGSAAPDPAAIDGLESAGALLRLVKWSMLFSRSRLELAQIYYEYFDPRADLAIPMLVDLDHGTVDRADTPVVEQVKVFDLLSQVSMLGLLPEAPQLRLHPFVGFDPFRQVSGWRCPEGRTALEVVHDAVLHHGFVGVKLYPEMGFRITGNTPANAGDVVTARQLDKTLDELFDWCAAHDVPITAHCNRSNYADPKWAAAGFGSPDEWVLALRRHPRLRVNLGHLGGAHASSHDYTWSWIIVNAMSEFEGRLFGDVACHRVDTPAARDVHFSVVAEMMNSTPQFSKQLLFGTDWYMIAELPRARTFTKTYLEEFQMRFADATADFMGGNALRFLGFNRSDDTGSAARVRQRYEALGATRPPWLAARG